MSYLHCSFTRRTFNARISWRFAHKITQNSSPKRERTNTGKFTSIYKENRVVHPPRVARDVMWFLAHNWPSSICGWSISRNFPFCLSSHPRNQTCATFMPPNQASRHTMVAYQFVRKFFYSGLPWATSIEKFFHGSCRNFVGEILN